MKMHKRLVVVFTCFFLLFLSCAKDQALAACPSDTVKIGGYSDTFTSIQDAYNYASANLDPPIFTLQLAGGTFTEDLILNGGAVVLDGGYDCSFISKSSASYVNGTITIGSGSLTYEAGTSALAVTSSPQCEFDRDGDGYSSINSCSGTANDCDDNDPNTYPGAPEICDGLDNSCEGQVDEGLMPVDADGDGYFAIGSCGAGLDDCNDTNFNINPNALDVPYDGIDQDCSGADLTFAANNDSCDGANCHGPDDAMAAEHIGNIATYTTCVLCHAPPVSNVLSGHYGDTVRTAGNNLSAGATINCYSCHDTDRFNHSGGIALGNGTNTVWGQVATSGVYVSNLSCDSCHQDRATGHLTATAHNNRIIESRCGECHTSDNSALGSAGGGTLANAADVNALHGVVSAMHCALCHTYTGTRLEAGNVRQTIQQGLDGTPVSCTDCHVAQRTNHYEGFTHSGAAGPSDLSYDAPGQPCGNCHVVANWTQIDNIEHNVPTNGAGSCATCHNSTRQEVIDALALGATPTYCLDCHSELYLTRHVDHVDLGYVTDTTTCLSCHDSDAVNNGTVTAIHLNNCLHCHTDKTSLALQPGVPVGGGECVTCHSDGWDVEHTPAIDHTVLVTVGSTSCADCHDDTLVSAAPETHDACGSCHDANGALLGSAFGTSFAISGDCTRCHTGTWEVEHTPAIDHTGLVTVGATSCADCHDDTLVSAAAETHDACGSCHDANGGLIGSAIGQTGSGDCTSCHTGTWDALHPTTSFNHGGLVTVGATACASCHDDTLVSAATDTHNDCTSCHDATTGALIGSAFGQTGSGDCATCHTGTWEALHPTTTTDHGGIVTVAVTACADCHDDTLISAAAETHNACASCHDATSGALISSAFNQSAPGDCTTCHTTAFGTIHTTHAHTVELAAGDLSFDPPGQLCSNCHVVSNWAEIDGVEHNVSTNGADSCSTCHNSPRQEVIDAITLGANPTVCLDCHSGKLLTVHGSADHVALGFVTVTATCLPCHDPGAGANATMTVTHLENCNLCHTTIPALQAGIPDNGGDCATCHNGGWETEHTPAIDHTALVSVGATDCASCHDDTLVSAAADTHTACASCHDGDGGLVSTAVGTNFTDGGDCATCHGSEWSPLHPTTNFNHGGLVTVGATGCADCHTDTLVSAATETHNACTSCHDATSGALIGSAIGQTGSGDCTTCHSNTWEVVHPTTAFNHGGLVTVGATDCASCHDDTLVSAAADTHSACTSCHDATSGVLIGLAIGQTGSGDCATCHSGTWQALHPTTVTDHTGIVTVGTTDCASCHDDTLISAAPETHNACISCHDANTGALIGSAIGQTGSGDCATCHAGGFDAEHAAYTHTVALGSGDLTDGVSCGSCHVVANWAEIDGIEHNVATNGTGSCATCHNSPRQEVKDAITLGANPTNCLPCHSGKDATHGSVDHVALGYVTEGPASCVTCHDSGAGADATVTVAHNGDCALCHTTVPDLQSGLVAGDCAACHGSTWDPLHPTTTTDHTPVVTVGSTGCADCHDDTLISAAADTHNACASCHDPATGALIGSAVGTSIATGGDCITCHTNTWEADHPTTAYDHSALVTVGAASCADCHDDTLISAAAETHNACISCHDVATGVLIGSAIGQSGSGDCATCHSGSWDAMHPTTNFNHGGLVTVGATSCASCHDDTLISAAPETHNACASCHDTNTGDLIGSAIGQSGLGDCTTCHSGTWEAEHTPELSHTALVTVGATDCASCHDDTLVSAAADTHNACVSCHDTDGGLVSTAVGTTFADGGDCATCHGSAWGALHPTTNFNHGGLVTVGATGCADCHSDTLVSAAAETHNACTSCHSAATGALIGSAIGQTGSGDCTTCHSGTWDALHPTTNFNHGGLVTVGATSCASCHDDTLVSAAAETHNACTSCHSAATGALIGSAIGQSGLGDCATCHSGGFDVEHVSYAHTVALGAADLSGGMSCGNCHAVANWTEIDTKHNVDTNGAGSCATCHSSSRQEVIDAVTFGANPTNCLPCHSDKTVAHADHVAAGYVTVGGIQDVYGTTCASCHDPGGASDATVAVTHNGDCALCHTTIPNLRAGIPARGGDCVSCHSTAQHTLWTRYSSQSCGTAACHDMNGGPGNTMHDRHNSVGGWSDRNAATSGMTFPYASNPEMWQSNWPMNPECATCHTAFDDDSSGAGCNHCHAFKDGNRKGELHNLHAGKGGFANSNCGACHK